MSKSLWKNKIWIIFLIVMLLLLPITISLPAQTDERSVAIAVGFDKISENEVEATVKIVVPQFGTTYSQNSQIITARGENAIDSLANISLHLGKILGLSHCSAILVGKSLKDENLAVFLDEIFRGKRVNYNALLISVDGTAKDILKKSIEIDKGFTQNIYDIVKYNTTSINAKYILLSDFYRTYYNGYGASIVPSISLSNNDYEGISPSQSSSNEGGSMDLMSEGGSENKQSSSKNQNQYLSNIGKSNIYKKGKFLTELSTDEVRGFGLLTNESERGVITLNNITDEKFTDASLVFTIRNRILTSTVDYSKTGIPRIYYKMICSVKLEQIKDSSGRKFLTDETQDFLTPIVKQKFQDEVKYLCSKAINKSKQDNFDILNIYQTFNRFSSNSWKKYMGSLENIDNYMQNVEFFMDVVIRNVD